jgi:hypothetical protein
MSRDFEDWTTEALVDYEFSLFELELAGEDTWAARDEVLQELNRRDWE